MSKLWYVNTEIIYLGDRAMQTANEYEDAYIEEYFE